MQRDDIFAEWADRIREAAEPLSYLAWFSVINHRMPTDVEIRQDKEEVIRKLLDIIDRLRNN